MSMAGFRKTTCVVCGNHFMDDCGDSFCSSHCENKYTRETATCEQCSEEVGEDNLTDGICEDCERLNEFEEEE